MKRIIKNFSLILILIFITNNLLAHGKSNLNFRFKDRSKFTIQIDQQRFNNPSKTINISNVLPGRRKIKAYKYSYNSPYPVLVYDGFIDIPASSEVFIDFNFAYFPVIVEVKPRSKQNGYMQNSHYNTGTFQNGYYGAKTSHISNREFDILLNSLENISFDNDRLVMAKDAIRYRKISSEQVYLILETFSFESSRLNYAKFAYNNTIDKHNYYIINEAFSFRSSIRELNTYIYS